MGEINCNPYGSIKDEKIVLEKSEQGDVLLFKSKKAFIAKEGICYATADLNTPEEITTYTYKDFLNAAAGNEELAQSCFEMSGDMNIEPDYYFEMGFEYNWFVRCKCGYIIDKAENNKCPKCGSREIIEGDWKTEAC